MRYENYQGRKNDVLFGLLVATMFAVIQIGVLAVFLDIAARETTIALHTAAEHVLQIARAGAEK
jgi:hypothetical protein